MAISETFPRIYQVVKVPGPNYPLVYFTSANLVISFIILALAI